MTQSTKRKTLPRRDREMAAIHSLPVRSPRLERIVGLCTDPFVILALTCSIQSSNLSRQRQQQKTLPPGTATPREPVEMPQTRTTRARCAGRAPSSRTADPLQIRYTPSQAESAMDQQATSTRADPTLPVRPTLVAASHRMLHLAALLSALLTCGNGLPDCGLRRAQHRQHRQPTRPG